MIDYRDMALKALVPGCQYASQNNEIFWDEEENNGVVCPSQEQIQAKIAELEAAEPMRLLRQERNLRLVETDWRMVEDYPMTNKLDWKTYRQALRDLPATAEPQLDENGMLTNITWPEVPE